MKIEILVWIPIQKAFFGGFFFVIVVLVLFSLCQHNMECFQYFFRYFFHISIYFFSFWDSFEWSIFKNDPSIVLSSFSHFGLFCFFQLYFQLYQVFHICLIFNFQKPLCRFYSYSCMLYLFYETKYLLFLLSFLPLQAVYFSSWFFV